MAVINLTTIEHVCSILDSFHQFIELTCDWEQNGKIYVLDILLIRMNDTLQTIYRKSTHNGVHLHCDSFALRSWKHDIL